MTGSFDYFKRHQYSMWNKICMWARTFLAHSFLTDVWNHRACCTNITAFLCEKFHSLVAAQKGADFFWSIFTTCHGGIWASGHWIDVPVHVATLLHFLRIYACPTIRCGLRNVTWFWTMFIHAWLLRLKPVRLMKSTSLCSNSNSSMWNEDKKTCSQVF